MKKVLVLLASLSLLVISACSSQSSSGSNFPDGNIEFIAAATPGGGWDTTLRSMKKVLEDEDFIKEAITVVNKPGGTGEVGWQYLKTKDAHSISANADLVITNNLLGHSKLTYKDFTPLAVLTTDWVTFATPKESQYANIKELMDATKADPGKIKIGLEPGLGGATHLAFVQAASESGVDVSKLNFLLYESGGDLMSAVLGNHVDVVVTTVSEIGPQYLAGKVNLLAVASEERIESINEVPTFNDEGINVVFPQWRGIMGPPNMSEEEIKYWDDTLGKMVESDSWKEILQNNQWESFYKNSSETAKFLEEQTESYKVLLKTAGMID